MRILSSGESIGSAMKLRSAIQLAAGLPDKTILVSTSSLKCAGHKTLLRYGCAYGNLDPEPEWGNKEFSAICVDKLETSNRLSGWCRVPEFVSERFPTSEEFPVLVRETLTGCQSKGIHVVHDQREFLSSWVTGAYWTKYFQHDIELRVNALFYPGVPVEYLIYKKVPRSGTDTGDVFIPGDGGVDNAEWVRKDNALYRKVAYLMEAINEPMLSMGARFVGIDLIYASELQSYVLLELNSGPWLTKYAANWLAGRLLARGVLK